MTVPIEDCTKLTGTVTNVHDPFKMDDGTFHTTLWIDGVAFKAFCGNRRHLIRLTAYEGHRVALFYTTNTQGKLGSDGTPWRYVQYIGFGEKLVWKKWSH